MNLLYIAYSGFDLASANSLQTYLTCRELARIDPALRIVLPRSPRRPADARDLPVEWVAKVPLRWLLGGRGEEIERRLFAVRAAGVAAGLGWPVYTRDDRVAARCAARGLAVVFEVHSLAGVVRRALEGARCVVTLNPILAERLRADRAIRRVEVIPDAFDAATFHPRPQDAARARLGISADAFVVGYGGLTFTGRGVDLLVAAFDHAGGTRDRRERRLVLLGGRPAERAALGVDGRSDVVAPGVVPLAEVAESLAAADVLVIPEVVNEIEASPLKMFEYAALGIPIVAVDRPAVRAVLGEDAAWFPPGDRGALAAALASVAAEASRFRERAERLRSRAAGFSYAERARRIVALAAEMAHP